MDLGNANDLYATASRTWNNTSSQRISAGVAVQLPPLPPNRRTEFIPFAHSRIPFDRIPVRWNRMNSVLRCCWTANKKTPSQLRPWGSFVFCTVTLNTNPRAGALEAPVITRPIEFAKMSYSYCTWRSQGGQARSRHTATENAPAFANRCLAMSCATDATRREHSDSVRNVAARCERSIPPDCVLQQMGVSGTLRHPQSLDRMERDL
jgi:hypothetical protein